MFVIIVFFTSFSSSLSLFFFFFYLSCVCRFVEQSGLYLAGRSQICLRYRSVRLRGIRRRRIRDCSNRLQGLSFRMHGAFCSCCNGFSIVWKLSKQIRLWDPFVSIFFCLRVLFGAENFQSALLAQIDNQLALKV